MATISLGSAPKSFKKTVTVPMLDGTEGTIECVFKYRTMSDYGSLVDELAASAGMDKPGDISWGELLGRRKEKNGEYLLKIIDGWNLDAEFTQANAQQLCDEFPGAANAIFDAYRMACIEGRLGN